MKDRASYIKKNVETSHQATESSRICKSGLTDRKVKLNSPNFDKLMKQRGLSKQARIDLKNSNLQGTKLQVRHAKAGEQFVTTHGIERSSGVFVSEKSLGSTPRERIDKGALPHSNTAEFETKVELARDQNIVYGKIAPQSKFSKMDPKQQSRNGGGEQVITDGGYRSGAIRTNDIKYPVPVKQNIMQRASEYKSQHGLKSLTGSNQKLNASAQLHGSAHSNSRSKGQSR